LRWVIGWITGLFGATTGGTEQLQIMPDSYIKDTNTGDNKSYLHLHIVNRGSDVTIYKIEVSGVGTAKSWTTATTDVTDTGAVTSTGDIAVPAGSDIWIVAEIDDDAVPGTSYTVKIYTKNGNVFTATVTAES